jgi:hypothetical protein
VSDDKKEENPKEQAFPVQPEKAKKAEVFPPPVEEFLETTKAPPEIRKLFREMASFSFTAGVRPQVHPIFDKFTAEHVTKFLDYNHVDDQNNYKLASSGRWIHLVWAAIILGFLVFLVIFLAKDNVILLNDILKILVAFAGGFGGGFGYRAYLGKSK